MYPDCEKPGYEFSDVFTGEKTGVRLVKVALSPGFPVWVRVELRRTQTGKPGDEAMVRAFKTVT